ncbi:hypothetical protein IV203_011528 [Nitzschia inconspicua]|uniref:Uncharacterized protein n=1 Tax=Nitzschia inconspicua TaxID=303405 RepID=A0A9K3KSY0_9STRA|nr:hypothetical protein IV203_011528 [Nitzschia inconspicua]
MSNKKRKFLEDFEKTLEEHLEELQREAEPIATRYVREVTGETTLRDGDGGLIYLPPFFTVRKCYANYCYQKRGILAGPLSKLKMRKPTRDICNFCYKFYNMHKYGLVESISVAEGEDSTRIEENVIESEVEDVRHEVLAETDADLNAPVAVTTIAREMEIAILEIRHRRLSG